MRERAEDYADFGQLLTEGSADGYRIEYSIDCHPGQARPLVQRHAKLLVSLQQLGVHLSQALGSVFLRPGCRVVAQGLEVHRLDAKLAPVRMRHGLPALKGGQAPLQQEIRLALAARDGAHGVGVQPRWQRVALHVGDEPVPVGLLQRLGQRRCLFNGGHGGAPVGIGCRFDALLKKLRLAQTEPSFKEVKYMNL